MLGCIGWQVVRLSGWQAGRWVDTVGRQVGRLGRLAGWQVGRLASGLVGRLAGWVGWVKNSRKFLVGGKDLSSP